MFKKRKELRYWKCNLVENLWLFYAIFRLSLVRRYCYFDVKDHYVFMESKAQVTVTTHDSVVSLPV